MVYELNLNEAVKEKKKKKGSKTWRLECYGAKDELSKRTA